MLSTIRSFKKSNDQRGLLEFKLDYLTNKRDLALKNYRKFVDTLRKDRVNQDLYMKSLGELYDKELSALDVVRIARGNLNELEHASSFLISMLGQRRKKQLQTIPGGYLGLTKKRDQLFANIIDVRVPQELYCGDYRKIPRELCKNVVLKPRDSSGSKGVFLVFEDNKAFCIKKSTWLNGWDEILKEIDEGFKKHFFKSDVWCVQELICENKEKMVPARDIKFYMFYGRIGLIQEVVRYPKQQYEFFSENMELAICGRDHEPRFKDKSLTITDKGGLTEKHFEVAKYVSKQIPSPYMRIDFLLSDEGLVFCEFSHAPGMWSSFNKEWDKILGDYYLEAEIRLLKDLVNGKVQFDHYKTFEKEFRKIPA